MFELNHPMDEIIENLYLGDLESSEDVNKLKELGIKKVLSILDGFWPKYNESDNIIHKTLMVQDYEQENIIKYFGECLNFIKGNEKILVHCAAGASRSATVVIAFLMWNKKMPYEDALKFTQGKRKIVWPNPGFKDQLKLFEKELLEKNYDIDKIKFDEIKWEPKDYGFFNF